MCLRLLSYRITIAHKHRHPMKIKKYAQVITSKEGKHYISNAKFKEERNGYHME
jgi:ABC-type molybdate transport system substrate-binding protein